MSETKNTYLPTEIKNIHLKNILYNIDYILDKRSGFNRITIGFNANFERSYIAFESYINEILIRHYIKISKQCLLNFLDSKTIHYDTMFIFDNYNNKHSNILITIDNDARK